MSKLFDRLAEAFTSKLEEKAQAFDQRVEAQDVIDELVGERDALQEALREVLGRFTYIRETERSYYTVLLSESVEGQDYRRWARIAGIKK